MMGFFAFILYFIFFLIGALLYVFYEGALFEQPNQIILIFIESLKIPGLLGIIAAAILAASMSSTSSALNSLATISVTDFYQKFIQKDASEAHYLLVSRLLTIAWGICIIPIAIAFASGTGSILEVLSKVGSYVVGAKLTMFGMGFFSKHVTERGLIIGVIAGFLGLIFFVPLGIVTPYIDSIWSALGVQRPTISWPWYPVIAATINLTVSWIASVCLDGFKKEWHPYSVPGQAQVFSEQNKATKINGWYILPGKVEPVVWLLPVFFIGIIVFLLWFSTLG